MRGVVALDLRRCGQDEEAGEKGVATRLGCARRGRRHPDGRRASRCGSFIVRFGREIRLD